MNRESITNVTSTLAGGITLATIALVPLAMMPITANFFETNKLALIIGATMLLLILWGIRTGLTKSLQLKITPVSIPLLAYGFMHFLSAFISTPKAPVDALMDRGSLLPALALLVVACTNLVENRKFVRQALYTLMGSGTVLAVITIFQSFGFGLSSLLNHFFHTSLSNTIAFTPAGSPLALLTFLLPVMLVSLLLAFTKKEPTEKVSLFILTALMAAAVVVTSVYSFPGKNTAPVFLPFQAGYMIAIETLKNPQTALVGVGTNQFVVAYNQFRPAMMNGTDFWNVRFNVSTNEIFQILTTVGVIGLGLFVWLVVSFVRSTKTELSGTLSQAIKLAVYTTLLLFLLLPATYLMLFSLAIFLLLWSMQLSFAGKERLITLTVHDHSTEPQTFKRIGVYVPAVLVIVLAVGSLYMAGRAYAAEVTYKQAIDAAVKNDGIGTYNKQRDAILQNPYLPLYRRAYASTNLALANAIAGKKDLTDADKNNIAQLIQQSIREAKIAVSLEPQNAADWENLAGVYQSLINAASGADQWTVAALTQAIQTDPLNPQLRVSLGGVYYSLGLYDQSIRMFQQATELKADYANAYYNLSHAYSEKKDPTNAYGYMQQALQFVKQDSADYTKAKDELTELAKQLPKQDQTQAQQNVQNTAPAKTNLQAPSPAPSPASQVNLPAGSGPENVTNAPTTSTTKDVNP